MLKNTFDRIDKALLKIFDTNNFKFDVHVHLVNKDYIPRKFFSIRMPYLVNTDFLLYIESVLQEVDFKEDDKLYNCSNFLEFVYENSLMDMASFLINNTPANTVFCPLMLDFSFSIDGRTEKDLFKQIEEMKAVMQTFPGRFLPFIFLNPNNPMMFEIFKKAFSDKPSFFGVKIYPTLGYMPSNIDLMKVFELCEMYDIPVTTHSGGDGVRTNHSSLYLNYFSLSSNDSLVLKKEKKTFLFEKQFVKFFNNPENWEPVLKAFPKLRLNLSHFGGEDDWDDNPKNDKRWIYKIIDLMERYPNVYTDISYILHLPAMAKKLLKLMQYNEIVTERVLFGSDFHFLLIEGKYQDIRSRFASELGSKMLHRISVLNPLKFLNLYDFVSKEIIEKWQQQIL